MEQASSHPAMKARVETLRDRIAALKGRIDKAEGVAKIEAQTRLADLQHRHEKLAEQLRALDGKGASLWQNIKAEFELMADDLTNSVDALTTGAAMLHEPHPDKPA